MNVIAMELAMSVEMAKQLQKSLIYAYEQTRCAVAQRFAEALEEAFEKIDDAEEGTLLFDRCIEITPPKSDLN